MERFYWVIPRVLAGCELPGRRGRSLGDRDLVAADLSWLHARGIRALISLTEFGLDQTLLDDAAIRGLHLPVIDLTPPTSEQIAGALAFIDHHRAHGRPVAVHCLMGQGRTGTVLAAYLIRDGASPDVALAAIREACPGAVENPRQEEALAGFARRRDWII